MLVDSYAAILPDGLRQNSTLRVFFMFSWMPEMREREKERKSILFISLDLSKL